MASYLYPCGRCREPMRELSPRAEPQTEAIYCEACSARMAAKTERRKPARLRNG